MLPGKAPEAKPDERFVTTQHTLDVEGHRLEYTATAGRYRVQLDEKPPVDLFFVAYVAKGGDATRPVTFAFNGGPGSASVWLHMGFFGPKRVVGDVDAPPRTPAVGTDNPLTLLTTTDLVFIDPASTGYSRPAEGKGREYHGVKADIESVAELIRRWVTTHGRWASPKYLAGESYGTTRAVGLARHLQERTGMSLDGLVLISIALKFDTLLFQEGSWLPYVMLLPAAAATAHYHGRVEADSVWALHDEVERFAFERYAPALLRGDRLAESEKQAIAAELARYLGLSVDYVLRCDLRVELMRFCRELLRDQRRTVGRLDARFTGRERDAAGEKLENDPSLSALMGPYTSALHHHLFSELEYDDAKYRYEILNRDVWPWTFDDCENAILDMGGALRDAMNHDLGLRVFVASGLYDLATPWAAAEYTLAQLQLEPERRAAITSRCYPAGHMIYIHEPSAMQLRADIEAFYRG
ncbi:MAG: peptidase S10 [Alphaproteobacteria bacterium]|nr:peptidase S10 [Alphaproteobacteria bacterium]